MTRFGPRFLNSERSFVIDLLDAGKLPFIAEATTARRVAIDFCARRHDAQWKKYLTIVEYSYSRNASSTRPVATPLRNLSRTSRALADASLQIKEFSITGRSFAMAPLVTLICVSEEVCKGFWRSRCFFSAHPRCSPSAMQRK